MLTVNLSRAYSNLAVLGDHGEHGTDSEAVSYTHLDVYKRQPVNIGAAKKPFATLENLRGERL